MENTRPCNPAAQFCRIGLSLLLAAPVTGPLSSESIGSGAGASLAANHSESRALALALAERRAAECGEALRRAAAVAPELLALADWPLDNAQPRECSAEQDAPVATVNADAGEAYPLSALASSSVADELARNVTPSPPSSRTTKPGDGAPGLFGEGLVALGNESLDDIRGGFEVADTNLKLTFGIERAVFINGELVATTVLNLKDLQRTSAVGGAPETPTNGAAGALAVIQTGDGNTAPAQVGASLVGTVVQNTLNNQKIQTVTTINAAVNSTQMLRAISVHSAIQDGIVSSLRR